MTLVTSGLKGLILMFIFLFFRVPSMYISTYIFYASDFLSSTESKCNRQKESWSVAADSYTNIPHTGQALVKSSIAFIHV